MENYSKRLQASGLKLTPQRSVITDIIAKYGHIDVDKLFLETKKVFESISLATLYKNIKLLQEKNLLREVSIQGHKSKYELNLEEHSHLICEKCAKVTDIDLKLPCKLAVEHKDFHVTRSSITLYGLCKNCENLS